MGVVNYLNQAYNKTAVLKTMSNEQQHVFEGLPAWAIGAFAVAVFSGLIASILLILRKKWARLIFIVSIIAAIAQFINWLFISDAIAVFGPTTYIMPIVVISIGIYEILFAKKGISKGWLN